MTALLAQVIRTDSDELAGRRLTPSDLNSGFRGFNPRPNWAKSAVKTNRQRLSRRLRANRRTPRFSSMSMALSDSRQQEPQPR